MKQKEVEHFLQNITREHLFITKYASDDKDYQITQFQAVTKELAKLLEVNPKLLDLIKRPNVSVVPPINTIKAIRMEHIGTSSALCLEFLHTQNPEELFYSADHKELVKLFFEKACEQARIACSSEQILDSQEQKSYENRLMERIQEYAADIQKRSLMVQDGIEEAKKTTQKAISEASKAKSSATTAVKAANEATIKADALLPNILTILGIFVAIIIAVVACYLSILLAKHGITNSNGIYSRPFEFMQFLLMGHVMLGVIFLLLYLVSKLTSHPLTCYCGNFERNTSSSDQSNFCCSECKNRCTAPARLRQRYPYVFGINLVFTIGYCVLGLWQVVNVYYRNKLDNLILAFPGYSALVFIALAIGLILAVCILFRRPKLTP